MYVYIYMLQVYKEQFDFLKLHKYKPQKRIIPQNSSSIVKKGVDAVDSNVKNGSEVNHNG